jgi:predicted oxidoreductase (fatty acid repression mutant protein)
MKNKTSILVRTLYFFYAMLAVVLSSCQSETSQKEFLIDNVCKMEKVSETSFVIENLDGYYTEKSISFQSDSSFTIICWGDRNSFLWNIRKDKKITVSIPYDRYKGKNVDIDVKLVGVYQNYR